MKEQILQQFENIKSYLPRTANKAVSAITDKDESYCRQVRYRTRYNQEILLEYIKIGKSEKSKLAAALQ